nr:RcnB family protein [Sphingobium sp.]
MLAGLMTATVMGGIAPALAQDAPSRGDRGERSARPDGGGWRGGPAGQPGRSEVGQRWQQRGPDRADRAVTQPRPDMQAQRWHQRGDDRPGRPTGQPGMGTDWQQRRDNGWQSDDVRNRPQAPARQDWRSDRTQERRDWRDDRRDDRQDWRQDRRDVRQDWRQDRRDDRRDWRNDRRDDRAWNGQNWNGGRRFDDRTRWSTQRRWDNGWRQDRRYDWYGYRNRYGDRYRIGRYYAPRGWSYGYQRYSVGIFLNSLLYGNSYWLDDPYSYRLPPAYGTLRWVRYYDDALLVDIRDGYVVDVIHDFFW